MDDLKKQVVERLKKANNILVTVRNNPSVDLLSACIGLALVLDKMEKHAAAVFSGEVPSAMEFLKPEDTIERTPDSLRDFIIALDKSKADKLRYKVEDKVVRIFITPYKTSLSQDDLEFSQGDFNVDVVVALGAHEQQELDEAITAHGRILHDAAVISINNTPNGNLGAMNWQEIGASSISEMVTQLVQDLGKGVLDEQISTALLTGIVAETARFSNEKTTPQTMSLAGELMAAGANQQLVATSLQAAAQVAEHEPLPIPAHQDTATAVTPPARDDGTLEINHDGEETAAEKMPQEPAQETEPTPKPPAAEQAPQEPMLPKIITPTRELLPEREPPHISNVHGSPLQETPFTAEGYSEESPLASRSYLVDAPLMPKAVPAELSAPVEPSRTNPLDVPPAEPPAPLIAHDTPLAPVSVPAATVPVPPSLPSAPVQPPASVPEPVLTPPVPVQSPVMPPAPVPLMPSTGPAGLQLPSPIIPTPEPPVAVTPSEPADDHSQTLREIEESVHSPHVAVTPADDQAHDVDAARSQVLDALQQSSAPQLEPLQSVGASFLSSQLHPPTDASTPAPSIVNAGIEVDADGNLKQTDHTATPSPLTPPAAVPPAPLEQSAPVPAAPPVGAPDAPPPGPPPVMPMGF